MSTINETLSEAILALSFLSKAHETADKETRNIIVDDLLRLNGFIDEIHEVNKSTNEFIKSLKKQYNVK